jgi:hypothetical protein
MPTRTCMLPYSSSPSMVMGLDATQKVTWEGGGRGVLSEYVQNRAVECVLSRDWARAQAHMAMGAHLPSGRPLACAGASVSTER